MEPRARAVQSYWAKLFESPACGSMCHKYDALVALANAEPRPPRADLREVARRWPGALREAELVPPARVEARLRVCRAAEGLPAEPRAQWRARGGAAIVLWSSVHARLRELSAARRAAGGKLAYPDFYATAPSETRRGWVSPEHFGLAPERRVDARLAYLAVAYHAGLDMPALGRLLFERTGHWDRGAQDPDWSSRGP